MAGRSVREILGGNDAHLGDPGPLAAALATSPGAPPIGQIGAVPLGARTGAPPLVRFLNIPVIPYAAVGLNGREPTLIAEGSPASRIVILTAPFVGFSIFIGGPGVKPGDFRLPPALPYESTLSGGQELYAVTDAPMYLQLQVQIAAILIGDRERR